MAATLVGTGAVASHRAAALLHRFDGFAFAPVEITVARGRHAQLPGTIVHRWSDPQPCDLTVIDGIGCTNVAATLAQLGAVVDDQHVEKALDDALRRRCKQQWIADTVERLHRSGPSGTGTLLRILADPVRRGELPDSYFERITQRILDGHELPTPVLQHPVEVDGRTLRIDIAWPEVKYGIECHSRRFHFGPSKEESDNVRDHALAVRGWHLDYITWAESRKPDQLVQHIRSVYRARANQLSR